MLPSVPLSNSRGGFRNGSYHLLTARGGVKLQPASFIFRVRLSISYLNLALVEYTEVCTAHDCETFSAVKLLLANLLPILSPLSEWVLVPTRTVVVMQP